MPEAAAVPLPAVPPANEAATAAQAQIQDPGLKPLTASLRELEGTITFQVPPATAGEQVQTVEILDSRNQRVKVFTWIPNEQTEVRWDGRDEQGKVVSSQETYAYSWAAAGQTSAANALPQVLPVLKLCFADGSTLEPQADFEFFSHPQVKFWNLAIYAKATGEAVRVLSGEGFLPGSLVWDGKTDGLGWAPTQTEYSYRLAIIDNFNREVAVSDRLHAVKARRVEAPVGKRGLLIPEILFDFNSAVLKPEMLDKLAAAAQVLKRYPGQCLAVCEGHADEIGSAEYNQVISRQRATMVAAFLADSLSVPRNLLYVQGFGKDRPEASGSSDEARARNRRVEIRLTLPAAP
jgi:outer membrane protein OmpA-like peptidoglycan-associated protein